MRDSGIFAKQSAPSTAPQPLRPRVHEWRDSSPVRDKRSESENILVTAVQELDGMGNVQYLPF